MADELTDLKNLHKLQNVSEYRTLYLYVAAVNDLLERGEKCREIEREIGGPLDLRDSSGNVTLEQINKTIKKHATILGFDKSISKAELNRYGNYALELGRAAGKGARGNIPATSDVDEAFKLYGKDMVEKQKNAEKGLEDATIAYKGEKGNPDKKGAKKELRKERRKSFGKFLMIPLAALVPVALLAGFGAAALGVVTAAASSTFGLMGGGSVVAGIALLTAGPWAISKISGIISKRWADFKASRQEVKKAREKARLEKQRMKYQEKKLKAVQLALALDQASERHLPYPNPSVSFTSTLLSGAESSAELESVSLSSSIDRSFFEREAREAAIESAYTDFVGGTYDDEEAMSTALDSAVDKLATEAGMSKEDAKKTLIRKIEGGEKAEDFKSIITSAKAAAEAPKTGGDKSSVKADAAEEARKAAERAREEAEAARKENIIKERIKTAERKARGILDRTGKKGADKIKNIADAKKALIDAGVEEDDADAKVKEIIEGDKTRSKKYKDFLDGAEAVAEDEVKAESVADSTPDAEVLKCCIENKGKGHKIVVERDGKLHELKTEEDIKKALKNKEEVGVVKGSDIAISLVSGLKAYLDTSKIESAPVETPSSDKDIEDAVNIYTDTINEKIDKSLPKEDLIKQIKKQYDATEGVIVSYLRENKSKATESDVKDYLKANKAKIIEEIIKKAKLTAEIKLEDVMAEVEKVVKAGSKPDYYLIPIKIGDSVYNIPLPSDVVDAIKNDIKTKTGDSEAKSPADASTIAQRLAENKKYETVINTVVENLKMVDPSFGDELTTEAVIAAIAGGDKSSSEKIGDAEVNVVPVYIVNKTGEEDGAKEDKDVKVDVDTIGGIYNHVKTITDIPATITYAKASVFGAGYRGPTKATMRTIMTTEEKLKTLSAKSQQFIKDQYAKGTDKFENGYWLADSRKSSVNKSTKEYLELRAKEELNGKIVTKDTLEKYTELSEFRKYAKGSIRSRLSRAAGKDGKTGADKLRNDYDAWKATGKAAYEQAVKAVKAGKKVSLYDFQKLAADYAYYEEYEIKMGLKVGKKTTETKATVIKVDETGRLKESAEKEAKSEDTLVEDAFNAHIKGTGNKTEEERRSAFEDAVKELSSKGVSEADARAELTQKAQKQYKRAYAFLSEPVKATPTTKASVAVEKEDAVSGVKKEDTNDDKKEEKIKKVASFMKISVDTFKSFSDEYQREFIDKYDSLVDTDEKVLEADEALVSDGETKGDNMKVEDNSKHKGLNEHSLEHYVEALEYCISEGYYVDIDRECKILGLTEENIDELKKDLDKSLLDKNEENKNNNDGNTSAENVLEDEERMKEARYLADALQEPYKSFLEKQGLTDSDKAKADFYSKMQGSIEYDLIIDQLEYIDKNFALIVVERMKKENLEAYTEFVEELGLVSNSETADLAFYARNRMAIDEATHGMLDKCDDEILALLYAHIKEKDSTFIKNCEKEEIRNHKVVVERWLEAFPEQKEIVKGLVSKFYEIPEDFREAAMETLDIQELNAQNMKRVIAAYNYYKQNEQKNAADDASGKGTGKGDEEPEM